MKMVNIVTLSGQVRSVPEDEARRLVAVGDARLESPEEATARSVGMIAEEDFDKPSEKFQAAGEGALSTLTLSGSDFALEGLADEGDAPSDRAKHLPGFRTAGEIFGGVVSAGALLGGAAAKSGGAAASAVGKGLSLTPGGQATKLADRAAKWAGAGGTRRVLAAGTEGAVGGALFGAGQGLSRVALSDEPLSIEMVASNVGTGVALGTAGGGLLSTAFGLGGAAARSFSKRSRELYDPLIAPEMSANLRRSIRTGFSSLDDKATSSLARAAEVPAPKAAAEAVEVVADAATPPSAAVADVVPTPVQSADDLLSVDEVAAYTGKSRKRVLAAMKAPVGGMRNTSPGGPGTKRFATRADVDAYYPPTAAVDEFSAQVQAAANKVDGWNGSDKVFVSDVFDEVRGTPAFADMTESQFKQNLADAQRSGGLTLNRADLVEAMDPLKVERSHLRRMNADFHFISKGKVPAGGKAAAASPLDDVAGAQAGKLADDLADSSAAREFLTVDEVAQRLRLSRAAVVRRIKDDSIPAARLGKRTKDWRVKASTVDRIAPELPPLPTSAVAAAAVPDVPAFIPDPVAVTAARATLQAPRTRLLKELGEDMNLGAKTPKQASEMVEALEGYRAALVQVEGATGDPLVKEFDNLLFSSESLGLPPHVRKKLESSTLEVDELQTLVGTALPEALSPPSQRLMTLYALGRSGKLAKQVKLTSGRELASIAALGLVSPHLMAVRLAWRAGRVGGMLERFAGRVLRSPVKSRGLTHGPRLIGQSAAAIADAVGPLGEASTKKDPVTARIQEISAATGSPARTMAYIQDATSPIAAHNVELGQAVAASIDARLQYYAAAIPAGFQDPRFLAMGIEPQASESQKKEFAWTLLAGEQPLKAVSIIEDAIATSGVIPQALVSAFKGIYPEMWGAMKEGVVDAILADPGYVEYRKRAYLSTLFDLKLDPTFNYALQLQQNYVPAEQPPPPSRQPGMLQNADQQTKAASLQEKN